MVSWSKNIFLRITMNSYFGNLPIAPQKPCTINNTHFLFSVMCGQASTENMCRSTSVWMLPPVNIIQSRTIGTVEHQILQAIPVSMWWSHSFHFSVWTRLPVNRIQSRNNLNHWAFNSSTDSSQYVVVFFFLFQCVDSSVCEHNSIKKQFELLST